MLAMSAMFCSGSAGTRTMSQDPTDEGSKNAALNHYVQLKRRAIVRAYLYCFPPSEKWQWI